MIAEKNPYGGVAGIRTIRHLLDANGWNDRPMIDTEHTGLSVAGAPGASDPDRLDAAYIAQELVIKRALKVGGQAAMSGLVPLKLRARGTDGEDAWGSLNADGSTTLAVRAAGLVVSKLTGYSPAARISGDFNDDEHVWVEKFTSSTGELYAYFKPFRSDRSIQFDDERAEYTLSLARVPFSAVILSIDGTTERLTPTTSLALKATNTPRFVELVYEH